MSQTVKTRLPPSPTGYVHMGNVRTLLFSYLYAKKHGGFVVFRSEDTDKARSKREYEDINCDDLKWLGLSWDEFYRQSERTDIYVEELKKLISEDKAYASKEESKMNPGEEVEVIRLRNPGKTLTFNDVIRGDITFDTTELGDIVIARSLDDPLYHFTVVVDDALMGITHVIRGEDHISNTPRQILIQEALGYERPVYVHLSIILAEDKTKLAKRHGSVSLHEYREKGFLPEALVNYLALLGWNPGTDQEMFSMEELIQTFDLSHVQKGGAVFNIDKLQWYNKEHLKKHTPEEQLKYLHEGLSKHPELSQLVSKSPAARTDMLDRISTWEDLRALVESGEFVFYTVLPNYPAASLIWKKEQEPDKVPARLAKVVQILENIDIGEWLSEQIQERLQPCINEEGKGNVLWPLRYALSGREKSPDPFTLLEALGKEESIARIRIASDKLTS